MKILFVEDDALIGETISETLSSHHYAVDVVTNGENGLEMALQWPYDLILLDVMLPDLSGIEVCRRLRNQGCQIPILILTARDANEDIVSGLDAGADDYLAKSCATDQLMARIRALLRRKNRVASNPLLTWGDLCLDPSSAEVMVKGTTVSFRPKEYSLLELFLRNPHQLLNRSKIIDHLWSYDDTPVEGSVTTLVKDLRRRLKSAGADIDPIETVYGLGYRLKPEPQAESSYQSIDLSDNAMARVPSSISSSKYFGEQVVKDVVQQANTKFRVSCSEQVKVLEETVQKLQDGTITKTEKQSTLSTVHQLVGRFGTFGYDNASAVAETLEEYLIQHLEQEKQVTSQFVELLEKLKQELFQIAEFPSGQLVDTNIEPNE